MTIITLKHPVTTGMGDIVDTITLSRPKLKYIREAERKHKGDETAQMMYMVSKLTGWVSEDLDEMDLEDWFVIQEAYMAMMGKSLSPAT